jgi:hypothetical protein
MTEHFLFHPGEWLGDGEVSFSMSPDVLRFRTKWTIVDEGDGSFECTQVVEIVGGDRMVNVFEVTPTGNSAFDVVLDNELLGTFVGSGVIDDKSVAWEFRDKGTFEGYEVYKRLDKEDYSMHAEYLSSDHTRTLIKGKIWKKLPRSYMKEDEEQLELDIGEQMEMDEDF